MTHANGEFEALVARLTQLWREYLTHGPGRLDAGMAHGLEQQTDLAMQELHDWGQQHPDAPWMEGLDALRVATRLATRCARRPEGLAFVSGEAGLIADRQAHQSMESALDRLCKLKTLREAP